MREFSIDDLLRESSTVTDAAAREPVGITQHNKVRFVLMAAEAYERLTGAVADPRKVYHVHETPRELAAQLRDGLDRIIAGEPVPDGEPLRPDAP